MFISEHNRCMGLTNQPTKTFENWFITLRVFCCTRITQLSEPSIVLGLENSFSNARVVLAQAIYLPKFIKIGWELFELLHP